MSTRKSKPIVSSDLDTLEVIGKRTRAGLIRKFQRIEGNFDCCSSAYARVCKQFKCLWRDECLEMGQG